MQSVQVVAAVIENAEGEILIARRPEHAHQGGLWEFPGGKHEPGEAPLAALRRELHEELGIHIHSAERLIQIAHQYPDKHVTLDVWHVSEFQGHAYGAEGQPVCWVKPAMLREYAFPEANQPILKALRLPREYLITPAVTDPAIFLSRAETLLHEGIRLLQFRDHTLSDVEYYPLASQLAELCSAHDAQLLLNRKTFSTAHVGIAQGWHLNSALLHQCRTRPVASDCLLAASCHTLQDIQQAAAIDVDFAVLSPVMPTHSHPAVTAMGWQQFAALCAEASIPVYALGGMRREDLSMAVSAGAQGIAAISGLWDANSPMHHHPD